MKKYAVIDIGSNSVRLMCVANGKVLYKRLNTTRLGEGLAQSTMLNAAAIERSAQAVATFYSQAIDEGAECVLAFATAAVRTAENGAVFVSRVRELCGLEVEVVSGETEAEIGILGALGNADGAVVDIGGASTEIVVKQNGAFIYKNSINIGVVRLRDQCGLQKEKLFQVSREAVKQFGLVPKATAYAIGGSATAIAAYCLELKEYDAQKVTGAKISKEQMQATADKLLSLTPEQIYSSSCMPKGRADVIAGGAVLFSVIMEALDISELIVSDRDNLEGYAIRKGFKV